MNDARPVSPAADAVVRPPPNTALDAIPLSLRMAVYGAGFLAFVLVLLPWLAHRVDVYWPQSRVEVGPLRWVGWVLFAALLAFYIAASYVLTSRGRGAYVEFDPPKEFVAAGPFRWCRNPIAGSLIAMFAALALALSSTGIFLLFLVAIPLGHAQVVLLEEPLLRQRFGQPYEQYLRDVPRWIPRPPRRRGGAA